MKIDILVVEQHKEHRNNPLIHGQLTYNKGSTNTKWGKNSLFNKWCWKNLTATCKRMKQDHYLT